ncbi:MAG: SRPBCC domain-containing protein [Chitinophagaceae bacterium]|nr:SRPBCC domain-containing protein [Chitinophagaceae bacterium]
MKTLPIKKSIELSAPKEIVWDVLLDDDCTRAWYAEFSEGTHAKTDWKVGSKAIFTDNTKSGMVAKVVQNIPGEILSMEYQGIVVNDIEDYEGEIAQAVKGGREIYQLTEKNGKTTLSIECDMGEDFYESMSEAWDRALQKIKQLSEPQEQLKP